MGPQRAETVAWLEVYNEKCQPRWGHGRLVYKASPAAKGTYEKPRGHLGEMNGSGQSRYGS